MITSLFDANTQSIAWIKQQYDLGNLELKPPFQRKPVWSARNKCALIETILKGWPVPEVYIQAIPSKTGDQTYAVVDGQQRIRSVLQFIGLEKMPDEIQWNGFPLDKLKPDAEYLDVTYASMTDEQRKEFFGYRFTVRWLNTEDDDLVRGMFMRLNKFSMPLKPQELRNSMFQGPFLKLSEQLADDEYWATKRIISPASIRRMGDVEFISDLLIGLIHGPQGGSAKIIDIYYQQYEDYDDEFPDQPLVRDLFNRVWTLIKAVLPDIEETRWRNKNDFYSLFVALGMRLRASNFKKQHHADLEAVLTEFSENVDKFRANETAKVGDDVKQYFAAVEKGANDKSRRGDRHLALDDLLKTSWFEVKKGPNLAPPVVSKVEDDDEETEPEETKSKGPAKKKKKAISKKSKGSRK